MLEVFRIIYSNINGESIIAEFYDLDRALSFILIPDPELPWHWSWNSFKEVSYYEYPCIAKWESPHASVKIEVDSVT